MKTWEQRASALRDEKHFGRPMRCFAERPASLVQMLREAIARNPRGEALVCGETRLTWAGLGERVAAAAGAYAARGVGPGDRVALLLGNRAEFPIAFLGAAWLGAIAVPVSIREQKPGLAYILGHCAAKVVVHEPDLAHLLPEEVKKMVPSDLSGREIPSGESEEEDTAAVLYTSGTTGRPKGAMLTNLGIVHSSMVFEACMKLDASTRTLAAVPLSHVTGVIALMAATVRCAGTLLVLPAFKVKDFLDLAERERMTYTLMVPAMYNLCLLEKT
ncbi:MAG TPA: class I adenylate-forming enzyme family protein, partial [Burkholderiales bacterium]|nr:class I adenylate-forming enzyme family protein [Burkholderiales bacterium]